MPKPFRSFYPLLILLGQRLREVSNLSWGELDLEVAEWLLPAARAKNKREHLVPLPDAALAILNARNDRGGGAGTPVFTTDGVVGISGFSKMKEALDAKVAEVLAAHPEAAADLGAQLADWVVHDLRRTLATGCQAMGFPLEVTDAVLNHVSDRETGTRGVYQLYDYFEQKADALERWGALITAAVKAWNEGDVSAVLDMDPVRRAKLARRKRRMHRAAAAGVEEGANGP